jgi:sodium transport system permease protein
MRTAWIVFRKELLDTLRDRRTIITMILIPLLLFPLMIGLSSKLITTHETEAQARMLQVGVLCRDNAGGFCDLLAGEEGVSVQAVGDLSQGRELVLADSLDALIAFSQDFDSTVAAMGQGGVAVYMKQTEERAIEAARITGLLDAYGEELRSERFRLLGLSTTVYDVISTENVNLATPKERLADIVGGVLPYMFVIFCFMGSMYPAIDLAAGEKERGTLETLLTSPVNRLPILAGKFGVVVLTGITSAVVSLLGLYAGIRYASAVPQEFVDMVMSILEPSSILMLISLLFPLTVFFAALLLSVSFLARSFKEAQSMIGPLYPVIIIPAFIGLMPGMELSASTALVPILNVSLATKAIIAGQVPAGPMALVYASLAVYAAAGLFLCSRIFARESAIFR